MIEKDHKEQMGGNVDRIREAFKAKDWNEIKTADSWQIFKVMGEFVNGFENLILYELELKIQLVQLVKEKN